MDTSRKELGKQMNAAQDKMDIIDIVVKHNCKNVLDLGAGTCVLSNQIAAHSINVTAVDKYLSDYEFERVSGVNYIEDDLCSFVDNSVERYDCVILSVVLHELSIDQVNQLATDLNKIISEDAIIIIREPIYKQYVDGENIYFAPFKSYEDMVNCFMAIKKVIPAEFKKRFSATKKLHDVVLPLPILALNRAFTYSYGEESWEREMQEYRFTFSYADIESFIIRVFGTADFKEECKYYFTESYYKHFRDAGFDDTVLNAISYTTANMVFKRLK